MTAEPRSTRLHDAVIWILLWTGLGLFFASEAAIRQIPGRERSLPWGDALLINIPFYLLWGVLALAVLWLSRRVPIGGDRRDRVRAVAIHLVASVVVASLHLVLAEAAFELIRQLARARDLVLRGALASPSATTSTSTC